MAMGGSNGRGPQMNVTPLVDVVLVLLIIFMVVTPLLTKQLYLHVPKDAELLKKLHPLERSDQASPRPSTGRPPLDRLSIELHSPATCRRKPTHRVHERRFAGPVRTDQSHHFTGRDFHADSVNGDNAPVADRDVARRHHRAERLLQLAHRQDRAHDTFSAARPAGCPDGGRAGVLPPMSAGTPSPA